MLIVFVLIILISNLLGCEYKNGTNDLKVSKKTDKKDDYTQMKDEHPIIKDEPMDSLELKLISAGLVDIQSVDSTIQVELKYSSTDNFMGEDVYGGLNRAYCQPVVADDLKVCQTHLKSIDSTLSLLVYDAVRPRSVQQKMWDILDMPLYLKTRFVSNPKNGSIHNYGAAIDLTIVQANGLVLDMGAGYDDTSQVAYPRKEAYYLSRGVLTQQQLSNRELLRKVMRAGGFYNIQTEWWHFNRYNREKAKSLFEIIE